MCDVDSAAVEGDTLIVSLTSEKVVGSVQTPLLDITMTVFNFFSCLFCISSKWILSAAADNKEAKLCVRSDCNHQACIGEESSQNLNI